MAKIDVPLTIGLFVLYRTIDLMILGANAGVPLSFPPLDQMLMASVIGAIAASVALLLRHTLKRQMVVVGISMVMGPLFILLSVALKNKSLMPAILSHYGFMTLEWCLIGLATAATLWPLMRRQAMMTGAG